MISSFDDFCLYVYTLVDDFWKIEGQRFRRPGPPPVCSDSELLTMVLVGECRGWDVETEMLQQWQAHRDLFPNQPSQSRFNRRRRQLTDAFALLQQLFVRQLDLAAEQICIIDSMPLPVVAFQHAPRAGVEWRMHEAGYGWAASKKLSFYGYRLHLLTTQQGLILDWEVVSAPVRDLPVAVELLASRTDLTVLGDKAYIHRDVAAELKQNQNITLLTLPRANQRQQLPKGFRRPFNSTRFIIETVISQLVGQFRIQRNHARTFRGLAVRLHSKLTAHTLCIFLNRLLAVPDFLQIKHLAFSN